MKWMAFYWKLEGFPLKFSFLVTANQKDLRHAEWEIEVCEAKYDVW